MIHLGNILEELEYDSINMIQLHTSYLLILENNNEIDYVYLLTEPINE